MPRRPGAAWVAALHGDLDPHPGPLGEIEAADVPNVLTGLTSGDSLVSVVVQNRPKNRALVRSSTRRATLYRHRKGFCLLSTVIQAYLHSAGIHSVWSLPHDVVHDSIAEHKRDTHA
jgi:hypothetical protein